MRRKTCFLAVAVVVGLFTTQAFAQGPHGRTAIDGRTQIVTVAHPGAYPRHGGYDRPSYHRYAYPRSYPYGAYRVPPRPPVIYRYPSYPPVVLPPVYPGYPHVYGPGWRYPSNVYYRGNGWGFSFSF
ncbi:MAG: hypothetical protein GX575_02070 [Candidatus Anammoximicrobium sp.]|mgnify:CR=1 FL=1|nr:hypothetical protein [Candidatus Anammoximicrobium sp.]